jgi:hypothetical protein
MLADRSILLLDIMLGYFNKLIRRRSPPLNRQFGEVNDVGFTSSTWFIVQEASDSLIALR